MSESTTRFPFGTPLSWEGMSEEGSILLCGLDLGENLEFLSTIEFGAVKLLNDTLVVAVQSVLDHLSVSSVLFGNDLLLLDFFFLLGDFDINLIFLNNSFFSFLLFFFSSLFF